MKAIIHSKIAGQGMMKSVPSRDSQCPICGAGMIETRAAKRCPRCQWSLCEACDGEQTTGEDNPEV